MEMTPGGEIKIPKGIAAHCGYVVMGQECPHDQPVGVPKEVAAAEYAARRGLPIATTIESELV